VAFIGISPWPKLRPLLPVFGLLTAGELRTAVTFIIDLPSTTFRPRAQYLPIDSSASCITNLLDVYCRLVPDKPTPSHFIDLAGIKEQFTSEKTMEHHRKIRRFISALAPLSLPSVDLKPQENHS
jgi:hypothetical protein